MRNLFFSIYGGIFISVLVVISSTYLIVQKVNSYRYQTYLNEVTQLTSSLLLNGIDRQQEQKKERWIESVSSLIDTEHKLIYQPERFTKPGIWFSQDINAYQLVIGPSKQSNMQLILSITDFSDTWLSATAFLTLNELGRYNIEQREQAFNYIKQYAKYPVQRASTDKLSLSTKQLRTLSRGDTVFTRSSSFGHQESVTAYAKWGNTDDALILGNIPYFDSYPLHILLSALLITLLCIAIIVWLFLEHLRKRVIQIQQTVDAIGNDQSVEQDKQKNSDSIADLNTKIANMAQRIERLLSEQAYMIRAISHDLRTPIAKLRFRLDAIESANEDDEALIEHCQQDISQLDQLIDELLTYEHLSTKPDIRFSKLKLNNLVQQEVSEITNCFADINFNIDIKTSNTQVMGNLVLLKRLLGNLLTNAGKYAHSQVKVELVQEQEQLSLLVQDDGPGFEPSILPDLFKPFYKADSARTFNNSGYGLGLAICQKISSQHKGNIIAYNRPAGGAEIRVSLPLVV